jgi:hypothetical protein
MVKKYMKSIKILSKYGTVKTCKVNKKQVVTIVLTDGFTENTMKILEFLVKCQELFPDYPKMETCITKENCAIVVLTK